MFVASISLDKARQQNDITPVQPALPARHDDGATQLPLVVNLHLAGAEHQAQTAMSALVLEESPSRQRSSPALAATIPGLKYSARIPLQTRSKTTGSSHVAVIRTMKGPNGETFEVSRQLALSA